MKYLFERPLLAIAWIVQWWCLGFWMILSMLWHFDTQPARENTETYWITTDWAEKLGFVVMTFVIQFLCISIPLTIYYNIIE